MSVYYYCDISKHPGWPDLAKNLESTECAVLTAGDILFLHWNDFVREDDEAVRVRDKGFSDRQVGLCGEIVFFSGNTTEMDDEIIEAWACSFNIDVAKTVFKFPENVNNDVSGKFGSYFDAFLNGKPPCRARDWFDPKLGEMKTAFKLLVQTWLVADDKAGAYDSDGKLKELLKKSWDELRDGFWRPVARDIEGKVLHKKLQSAHSAEGEPDWKSIDLTKPDASELRDWAFSDK